MMIAHGSHFFPAAASLAGALILGSGLVCAAGEELPVPNVTIYPGDVIGQNLLVDKAFQFKPGEELPVFRERDNLVGKIARRTLVAGKPIPLNAVREVDLIAQGKPVVIMFKSGGLTITGQGVTLQAGKAGDFISVRNSDSGMVVKGIVQADGTVRVTGQ
jgi:flagellar basal body P-ring formation protein FlgA